jgi:NCAIR mutase (PurE)-related protein
MTMMKTLLSASLRPTGYLRTAGRRFSSNDDRVTLSQLFRQIENGSLSPKDAEASIQEMLNLSSGVKGNASTAPNEVLSSFANLDHSRSQRTGFPEAIFAAGKSPEQIAAILDDMAGHVNKLLKTETDEIQTFHKAILATRVDEDLHEEVSKIPLKNGTITYHRVANIISMKAAALEGESDTAQHNKTGRIVVACAGTTDLPVAEEAAITLEAAGCDVDRIYDVGVAGLHRILNALPKLRHKDVDCVIVCAGMDGALPSVVAGLVEVPVVAVPTSVGYGASFGGVSAMLTMLNSCAPGVGVVNIDNGFGGAALAFKCITKK